MATPTYVKQMNVNLHSDQLSNVVVLGASTDGGHHVLLWDNLSIADRELVDLFMKNANYESNPTPAVLTFAFNGEVEDTTPVNSANSVDFSIVRLTVDGVRSFFDIEPGRYNSFETFIEHLQRATENLSKVVFNATPNGFTLTTNSKGASSTIVWEYEIHLEFSDISYYIGSTPGTDGNGDPADHDLWEQFQAAISPNGARYSEVIPVLTVLPFRCCSIVFPKQVPNSYYDDLTKQWLYKVDASSICS